MPQTLDDAFFRSVFESDIAGIAVADLRTQLIVEVNARLLEIVDRPRDEIVGVPDAWMKMTPEEYHPLDLAALDAVLAGRRSEPFEKEYLRTDGSRVPVRVSTSLVSGHPDKLLIFVTDLSEQRRSERESRNMLDQLRNLADSLPALIAFIDRNLVYRFVNSPYETWFGRKRREIVGMPVAELIGEQGFRKRERAFRKVLAGEPQMFEAEMPIHDGTRRTAEIQYIPRLDTAGEIDGFYVLVHDVTERKVIEDELRQSVSQKNLLIGELNHRVKNTLAVVQSLAWQTFRKAPIPPELRQAFEQRLVALATAHDVLTRKNWNPASVEVMFRSGLHALGVAEERLTIAGPLFRVPPKTAVSLAMAVHELATNALKYGSLTAPEGRVELTWEAADGRFHMTWREHSGPPVVPPERRGFGSRLIEQGLAAELGGEARLEFAPDGVTCTIDAPLPRGAYVLA
jgi:PAS domain S-box-containing protein